MCPLFEDVTEGGYTMNDVVLSSLFYSNYLNYTSIA